MSMLEGDDVPSIAQKIACVSEHLTFWNKDRLGNIGKQIKRLQKSISNLSKEEPIEENIERLKKAKIDLNEVLIREEIMWRQRSRIQWIRTGDKNTKFFHFRTLARKGKNRISCLQDDSRTWHEGRENVLDLAQMYFNDLFTTSEPSLIEDAMAAVQGEVSDEMN